MEISTRRPAPGRAPGPVPAYLGPALAGDPTRPLLTYYDDATGERTELSAVTLGNWVVKTANLLLDGCGLGEGDRAAVLLPPHWQTAAVLLGAWTAGLTVVREPAADPVEVAFATPDRLAEAPGAEHRFVLGLAPMGAPLPEPPAGWQDYAREVLAHGDRLPPYAGPAAPGWQEQARRAATEAGLRPGDRVLVDAAAHPDPVWWLLAPLTAGASVVLCAHLDPAAVETRVATEKVTRLL